MNFKRKIQRRYFSRNHLADRHVGGFQLNPQRAFPLAATQRQRSQEKKEGRLPKHQDGPNIRVVMRISLLAALGCFVSCTSPSAEALAWSSRPDFSNPENAGKSMLAAVAADHAQAEYLCWSESLKAKTGATLDAYLLARPALRQAMGSTLDYAFELQLQNEEMIPRGRLLWWTFRGKTQLGLVIVPQHYFDLETADGRQVGAFLDQAPGHYVEREGNRFTLILEDSILRLAPKADELAQFILATEWKIADILDAHGESVLLPKN